MDNARTAWELPTVRAFFAFLVLVLAVTGASVCHEARAEARGDAADARADAKAHAEALYERARSDDERFAFASALAAYDQARALDPSSRNAPRAEARAAFLRSHSEGEFVPLVALERVRRDPALATDAHAIDALVRAAESFPPGQVRVEAWVLAAEGYGRRFNRPDEAMALYRRILDEPSAPRIVTQKASRDLVAILIARNDFAAAREVLARAGDRADPKLAREVGRLARRQALGRVATAALVAMAALALRAFVSAARRGRTKQVLRALARIAPVGIGYAAYVGVLGGLLASGFEAGTARPFLILGLVLVPLLAIARIWGASTPGSSSLARLSRAVLCGVAVTGAAFLVVRAVDVAYLEGMGL
ncbi:hypothetical protein AKJ09_07841 [Labilithrix luteola]|uniref:Uncharacterized protein n=1 Tax=Labilithrix luteola TaxID=1391654 RepID=A0A0K1Q616_9BACT|nr:hypothetical protein [Labilithrix luteola]AKV01178.1 hypothetical protein AKJ09_07841 [Labilithrix luteola]